MGAGLQDKAATPLHEGRTNPPLFDKVIEALPPRLARLLGTFWPSESDSDPCSLLLQLNLTLERHVECEIHYGTKSERHLPELREIQSVFAKAVGITDPWWHAQHR